MNDQILGLIVFLCAYVISRVISENNLKKLSGEEKSRLIDAFSGYRIYSLVTIVGLALVFIIANTAFPRAYFLITICFLALLILSAIISSVFIHSKLKDLNLHASYRKTFWLSAALQYFGLIFLFITVFLRYFY